MYLPLNLTLFEYLLFALIVAALLYMYDKQRKQEQLLPYRQSRKKTKILSVIAGENVDTTSIEKALYATDITYNLLPYDSVSQESLLAELDKNVTVFELSSHGLNGSFRLGNTTIPATWLASVLSQYNSLECCLLLYCNSYIDQELIAHSKLFVISLVGEVKDTTCILFARRFYYFLNKQFDYKEAFEHARLHLPVDEYAKFLFCDGRQ